MLMHWISFGWMIEINKVLVVSSQVSAMSPNGESHAIFFMTGVNVLTVILVKYGGKLWGIICNFYYYWG